MKVVVDFDACQSHALCVQAAPEIFAIDDDGYLEIKIEEPGEDLRAKLETAERECPTMAITIEEG